GFTHPRPAFDVHDPAAHRTLFCIDHVLPLETIVAGHATVTTCPANECAYDVVTTSDRLTLQLAVNHVAALVGPDASALHTCTAVGEPDRLRSEPDRRPLCAGEQHGSCEFEDGCAVIGAETERPARACCSPRALKDVPFAGGRSLWASAARLTARARQQEKCEHSPSPRILSSNHIAPFSAAVETPFNVST